MKYRILGSSALRVSEVALGTMTFGERWGWGASLGESRLMLDLFLDRGGNFVDTASNYTDGESEEQLGELLEGRRDRIVLATKYTLTSRADDPNAGGNHRKNLVQTLEQSLRRLRTDRIDLLWMHMWDGITPIDDVVRALDDLAAAGKVLAVGISDTPAWVVSRAAAVAELRGWTRPSAIQLPYSLSSRDAERELLPMAASLGLGVLMWGILDGGVLTGKYTDGASGPRRYGDHSPDERHSRLAALVRETGGACDASPAQVCIAWVLAQRKRANLIPILGARTADQLADNLAALDVVLPAELLASLDEASAIKLGFPGSFLADEEVVQLIFGSTRALIAG
ncbi:MAG TPA: aldo/keto reductase [Candidatus Dormibacteraeota bacterium]|jgi:aryl-alcohol dehydrogenase-like predicted oxidoreductase|nr:aldo/keto reductase [Candidatus Dormibacteraeota bacterium]